MAEVQDHQVVSHHYVGPDRRRGGPLGTLQRGVIKLVRSKWIAMFAIAFAVSFAFAQVDNIGERRLERQQEVIICTIKGVADAQIGAYEDDPEAVKIPRVVVGPILKGCEKQAGK
jgi:hypothetical protein